MAHVYALMPPGASRWVGGACPRLAEAPSAASLLGSEAPAAGDQGAAAGGIAEMGLQSPGTALIPFLALIPVVIIFFSVASCLLMSSPDSELYEDRSWSSVFRGVWFLLSSVPGT